jgi:predicted TIM-barrel fold metal-dependent hydrolase
LSDYSVASVFGFIRSFYAYRFEHVYYLLRNYGCEHGTVQMIAAALVDYDYPLGAGHNPPPSLLTEQFKVMARISEVFGGRVLSYLPFDPWRVAYEGPGVFEAIKDYIAHGAAVGLKLYPPMGFAPLGNARLTPPPCSWPSQPGDFGGVLDKALTDLWAFAIDLDVPVIAHSGQSNAPADDRVGLGSPEHWQPVFDSFPAARVCFGHFGGERLLASPDHWPRAFLDLVSRYDNAYGDIAYFEDVLGRNTKPQLARRVADFLSASSSASGKMIYGSDWVMLGIEAHSELYFQDFAALLADPKLFKPDIPARILGQNAIEFLGLRPGYGTRSRLETFYSQRGVDAQWLSQIA